ncbi:MAG: hypothetical protein ACE14M_01195 [Terriglobales bacterium]
MPLLEKGVHTLTGRMPKVISPKVHAIIDYAVAGSFLLAGALAWKRDKKSAISSFIVGGAGMGIAMTTDYPGGVWKLLSFPTHGKIDVGFAGMISSMPNLFGFDNAAGSWFFRSQGMAMAAVTGLTDFRGRETERMAWPRYGAA